MYLAFLAGEHPGLSRFDLLAMEQQCVMRQTVRRVTEKVSFRCRADFQQLASKDTGSELGNVGYLAKQRTNFSVALGAGCLQCGLDF